MIKKNKLVHTVVVNDYEGSVVIDYRLIRSYDIWCGVLRRCYSDKQHLKQPTYIGCTVCDEWLSFSTFKQWYDQNYVEGFELDKDILIEGNKVYSPETCRFIPQYLNVLLNSNSNQKGDLPTGIRANKPNNKSFRITTTYQARCNNGYCKSLTKTFKTIPEAQAWYSETKKRIVKEQATRAFLDNAIKTDIYLALVRRNFN